MTVYLLHIEGTAFPVALSVCKEEVCVCKETSAQPPPLAACDMRKYRTRAIWENIAHVWYWLLIHTQNRYDIAHFSRMNNKKHVSESAMKKNTFRNPLWKKNTFRNPLWRKTRFGIRYEEKLISVNAVKKNSFIRML